MPHHSAFELIRTQEISSLGIQAQEYRHRQTGAQHFHLKTDYDENVFLVALRTIPTDSTGVAHILEHTVLCGSEKYPVRDPFFTMIRRSLNTFMNAFTSSDWTAYPFASENRKDFFNLLDVYLDAVFFSNLNELDFKQEGHRLEFENAQDASSALQYKGVVFNEMKGAMSSATQKLWRLFTRHLWDESTYHHNSGGEPVDITDLSYEQLKEFYRVHYHPSNAIFMTFGNIPVEELQQKIHDQALSRFEPLGKTLRVMPEPVRSAPRSVVEKYAVEEGDLDNKTHVLVGWMLGDSANLFEQMEAHLISNLLLDNSASPLRKALEQSDLGVSPSPLCGLETSNREMAFVCGLEGSNPDQAEAVEQLILDTLKKVADEGVPQEQLEAVLHQLEFSQREIGGDSYPYGLQLILGCLPAAVHDGDALADLDIDPILTKLRENITQPAYIPDLIHKLFLNNYHRTRLVMEPDAQLAAAQDNAEREKLDAISASLSDEQKQQLVEQARLLEERQAQQDDPAILPKVTLEDVPADIHHLEPKISTPQWSHYQAGSNGISYVQVVCKVPELTEAELQLVPTLTTLLTELGTSGQSYLDVQGLQARYTGGLNAWMGYRSALDSCAKVTGHFVLSGKALDRNVSHLEDLMMEHLQNPRFDELDRIYELISQIRTRKEQSITGNGHALAMGAASASWSLGGRLNLMLNGLESIQYIKRMHDGLADEAGRESLSQQLVQLHRKLLSTEKQVLTIADHDLDVARWQPMLAGSPGVELNAGQFEHTNTAWMTNTQVNFCAKAYPTVAPDHPDNPVFTILAGILRNHYLHSAIREKGGAYGGGASHDSSNGVFRFYSYRDPRLKGTLDDFDKSLQWFVETEVTYDMFEEALLGVISSMDKPASPSGEAKSEFYNRLYGRTPEQRRQYREQLLSVSLEDLKRVTEQYLLNQPASTAVITQSSQQSQISELGLTVLKI
ncbi:insulinase family protein [Gynuella sunshinyii]|nr:insulinase family protein [Gynuella sunshinyii]AJQ95781.1 putative Zn-dependent peptidase, insulinase-like [Gynuella sunshinyii YC6258]